MFSSFNSQHLSDFAAQAAGNWQRWTSCAMWGDGTNDNHWFFFEPEHRDSDLLDKSNTIQIKKALEPWTDGDDPDVIFSSANCSLVGWRTQIRVCIYRQFFRHAADGCLYSEDPESTDNLLVTPAARTIHEIILALANYPIFNDEHYSELEYEEWGRGVSEVTGYMLRRLFTLTEGQTEEQAVDDVSMWLSESEVDTHDWPDEDDVKKALIELGYQLDEE